MSDTSCTPVVIDGWGGAGDGCLAVADAGGIVGVIEDSLRAAFPDQWQSSAADEFAARLTDLLFHAGRLGDLVATAHERAAALAAAVAAARSEP